MPNTIEVRAARCYARAFSRYEMPGAVKGLDLTRRIENQERFNFFSKHVAQVQQPAFATNPNASNRKRKLWNVAAAA